MNITEYKKLKKRNKYGAKKAVSDGITFDSKWERDYYNILKLRKRDGEIADFRMQERVDLIVNGKLIAWVKVDFVVIYNNGLISYEDTKGVVTPIFRLKAKLFKALIGKEIHVIKRK